MQREMNASGYQVYLAENSRQVFFWLNQPVPPDLLIVDPDFADEDAAVFFRRLNKNQSGIPVVVHSHEANQAHVPAGDRVWFVRKEGNSIEALRRVIYGILEKTVQNVD